MEKILISACLVGENTRYDGKNNYLPIVEKLKEKYELIPFCPEVMGGLLTPREPCEIQGPDVKTKDGVSKVKEYNLGAKKALEACRLFGIRIAILAESSPSCGVRNIYDGHFNQTKIPGKGITTRLLEENGIACYSSLDDLSFLFTDPEKKEKEYLSYEERDYQLRHPMKKRRFGDRKPRFVKKDEEKPGEEKASSNEGEKKEFTKKEGFHKEKKAPSIMITKNVMTIMIKMKKARKESHISRKKIASMTIKMERVSPKRDHSIAMTRNVLMGRRTSIRVVPSIKGVPSIKEENHSPKEEVSKKATKRISLTRGPLWALFY